VFLSIHTIRFPKNNLNLDRWKIGHLIWNKDFCWRFQVIWDGGNIKLVLFKAPIMDTWTNSHSIESCKLPLLATPLWALTFIGWLLGFSPFNLEATTWPLLPSYFHTAHVSFVANFILTFHIHLFHLMIIFLPAS
jgi:hypothetical protein